MVKASPLCSARPGAPDAVDVILRMLRHVVIDDVAHLRDVESARGDVRGDERLELAVAETAQRLLAFALGAVGMQHGHGVIAPLEQAGDAVRAVLRPAEDEHGIVIH